MRKIRFKKGDRAYTFVETANGYVVRSFYVYAVKDCGDRQYILVTDEWGDFNTITTNTPSWEFRKTKKQAQKDLERHIKRLREKDASWENRASVRANKKEFAWFISDFESDLD